MHINMKYYIVTIGAIFIALGIGILVGFNLNYDQELSKQQAQVINDLDKKFEGLKEVNDGLEEKLASLQENHDDSIEFINNNSDKLIVDTLTDKKIGIISTNENKNYTNEISEIITKANGEVAFEIVINESIVDEAKLKEASTKLSKEIKTTTEMINYIVECLKSEEGRSNLEILQSLEIVKINSLSADYSLYESVVLTGGSEHKDKAKFSEEIDKALIPSLKGENKYVVGVQKSNAKFSYIDLYKSEKIATIDNVEEGIGKIALVLLVKDASSTENYGRLESAESLLPYKK